MQDLITELSRSSESLVGQFQELSPEKIHHSPSAGRWSAAQIVHHLTLVDRGILAALQKALERGTYRVPLYKRILPIHLLVRSRIIKVNAPEPVVPGDVSSLSKEDLIARYQAARSALIEFVASNAESQSQITWKHARFGILSLPQTLRFIAAHEARHMTQMREVTTA